MAEKSSTIFSYISACKCIPDSQSGVLLYVLNPYFCKQYIGCQCMAMKYFMFHISRLHFLHNLVALAGILSISVI